MYGNEKEIINGKAEKYFEEDSDLFSSLEFNSQRQETIKVNSAILFDKIQRDKEIMNKLIYWKENAEFEINRKKIEDWLQQCV